MNKNKLSAMELFSGAGGVTEAIKNNFELKCAIEFDPIVANTYKLNHGENHLFVDDIKKLDVYNLLEFTNLQPKELDLLVVTAPCQGFSRHRRKKATENKDRRNKLIMQTIKYAKVFKPKYIFFENVSNIINFPQFSRLVRILSNINNLGYKRFGGLPSYHIRHEIIDSSDFNVPQKRKRLILVAKRIDVFPNVNAHVSYKKGKNPIVNHPHDVWPEKQKSVFLGQYLNNFALSNIKAGETCKIDPLHKSRNLSNLNKRRIQSTPKNGGSREGWPDELQLNCHKKNGVSYGDVYGRMSNNEYSPTITTGCTSYSKGRFGHPISDRAISLREAALIQTFPHEYKFTGNLEGLENQGSLDQISTQIGNAVPVNMAKAFVNEIINDINKEKRYFILPKKKPVR